MNCTASSYFIPHSISARATKTGALVKKKNIRLAFASAYLEESLLSPVLFSVLLCLSDVSSLGKQKKDGQKAFLH